MSTGPSSAASVPPATRRRGSQNCTERSCGAVCCSVVQCVAACSSVLQRVAVCCSVLPCVAACCSVYQCVAVCCSCRRRNFRSAPSSPVQPPPHNTLQHAATHGNTLQHTATRYVCGDEVCGGGCTQSPHTYHLHIHITCTTHTHHTHTAPTTGREPRGCRVLSKPPYHKSHVKRARLKIERGLSCIKRAMLKEPCQESHVK